MIRAVTSVKLVPHTACERLGARAHVTMDCGHTKIVKASRAPLYRTRCPTCSGVDRVDAIDSIDKDEAR